MTKRAAQIAELWRYYKIGVVNSAFGYGFYALLVFLHFNIFAAQIIAHVTGMVFNFFMFKIHVFPGVEPRIGPYVGAYAVNYLLGLGFLSGFHLVIRSAYAAGFCSMVCVSVINYFILKRFVFRADGVNP